MAEETVRPFGSGSQYADWTMNNCDTCTKAAPRDASLDEMPCQIEKALAWACVTDGMIPLPIANAMGHSNRRFTWPCLQHDPPFVNVRPDGTVDESVEKPVTFGV
jgi:hypothetical protein